MSGTDERDDEPGAPPFGLPAVLAPLAGALLIVAAGLWFAWRNGQPITPGWVAGSALTGALIGVVVMLIDGGEPGMLVPRFLALVSPLAALLGIVGLPFVLAAWMTNRRRPGPYRTIAKASLVVAGLVSVIWVVALVLRR